jgi:DNA polymerase-1
MTEKKDKKILVILDAHALIHRSFHAMPSFSSPSGEPMGAVYGVSAVLLKLIRELRPTHIAAAFDRAEPTFRHVAYENYKATRAETKSDLVPQFDKVKEIFTAFGIPMFEVPGFEADDIIGTLVERYKNEKDITIIIASGDMDTLQLVDDDRVLVYTLRKGIEDTILYDQKKVEERFGFPPKLIIDYKGLKGDPSDNIIGVKGIGEKTATELIKYFGTIEEIFTALKKLKKYPASAGRPAWLKERIAKLLLENEEEALFSKELASIRRDAPVSPELETLVFKGVPYEAVSAAFRKFYFPSLIARLPAQQDLGLTENGDLQTVTRELFSEFEKTFSGAARVGIFIETESLVFVLGGFKYSLEKSLAGELREQLQKLFHTKKEYVAHDAKEIYHALGFTFEAAFDTRIAAWVCDSERRLFLLGDVLRDELPSREAASREALFALEKKYRRRLEKENLTEIYFNFELPLIQVLFSMERAGIAIDEKKLATLLETATHTIDSLRKEITEAAGEEFDVNSPKQLSHILFNVLKLPAKGIKKTSTKAISTQASELEKLRGTHPIIDLLLKYREIAKLLSTYISVLPALRDPGDGRIHTTYNQTGTATGRLSSANPNLQNIPIRTDLGREIRRAFVASRGYELVSFDYSQIELRIAAALSKDKNFIAALHDGDDIHARTAALVFRMLPDAVTPNMRRYAKAINFGILYGMGARALAASMGVSHDEAEKHLDAYLKTFPGIEELRLQIIEDGRQNGFVTTLFGRKRYIPNLRSSFEYVRKEAERMAMNAPIQGTAADLIKRAMIRIDASQDLSGEKGECRLLLQVHDELLFEMRKENIKKLVPAIKHIMETAPELAVPIIVDVKHGANWQDMSKYIQ